MKRKAIAWLMPFLFLPALQAQNSWEAKLLPGFLVPHHADMAEMMKHTAGIEIGRQWRIDSAGTAAIRQHHPLAGIGFTYFQLGSDIAGKAFALNLFYEAGIPVGKNSSLRARLSTGAGYLTAQFHPFNNPKNGAIGSHVNGYMQLLTYMASPIGRHTTLTYGIGMSHFSNGNWGQPNLGINLPSLALGLQFNDHNTHYLPLRHNRGNHIIWEFSLRAGKRQMSIDDPRNIANYMIETIWNYPHNQIRNWRGGLNIYYDRTYLFEKFQPLPKGRPDQVVEVALTGGHEYRINRVGFITDMGFYLYRPDRSKRMYYEAVGIKYYLNDQLMVMTRLKAHLSSADYFEWGITYALHGKRYSKPGFGNALRWQFSGFKPIEAEHLNF